MSHAIDLLQADHRQFLRLIEHMEGIMESCLKGDDVDLEVIKDFVKFCSGHADEFHHPLEDRLFSCLLKRKPSLAMVIRQLEQEHLHLRWATRELRSMLDAIGTVDYVRRDRFLEALGEYLALFYQHIHTEEVRILKDAGKLLGEDDWRLLDAWLESKPVSAITRRDASEFTRLTSLLEQEPA